MPKFSLDFKVLVGFILIVVAFIFVGGNQALLNKEVTVAEQDSNQAVNLSAQTLHDVKDLTTTPTATPEATVAPKAMVKPVATTPVK